MVTYMQQCKSIYRPPRGPSTKNLVIVVSPSCYHQRKKIRLWSVKPQNQRILFSRKHLQMSIHLANENKLCQKNYISKETRNQISPSRHNTQLKPLRLSKKGLWEWAGHANGIGLAMLLSMRATNSFLKMQPLALRAAEPWEHTASPGPAPASVGRLHCLSAKTKAGPCLDPQDRCWPCWEELDQWQTRASITVSRDTGALSQAQPA